MVLKEQIIISNVLKKNGSVCFDRSFNCVSSRNYTWFILLRSKKQRSSNDRECMLSMQQKAIFSICIYGECTVPFMQKFIYLDPYVGFHFFKEHKWILYDAGLSLQNAIRKDYHHSVCIFLQSINFCWKLKTFSLSQDQKSNEFPQNRVPHWPPGM